jgi:hypothetical protein
MYPRDIRVENPEEALIVEQALAMYRELRQAAADAPDGQVIDMAERLAIARGRELTRRSVQTILQEEARATEKKLAHSGIVPVAEAGNTGAAKPVRSSRRPAR